MRNLCTLREIYRVIRDFEEKFQQEHGLSLNEGMLLCGLKSKQCTSSEIAKALGLTNSNTSKVIKSAEDKGYIERSIGKDDKRQMYFSITEAGRIKIANIGTEGQAINTLLKEIVDKSKDV
ncbi:MarR family winged helix-turn-helix transcriptional regulator [Bacteroides sp. 224]|uniref:MarR family winged helix-turn-helix transcriptional regulator n=1 Tax=Bacteroides sp. 224 TaxID=2302936 RepID=UPI0013D364AD|nr:winged helix DNA-binding protein [Bacteroides sp. 224]NDV65303.1 MarR family transcriptional regulator [Bacteroides sp. 224]